MVWKAYVLDLVDMHDKCDMYSLIIHNIRLCYHGDFPRARQIDDKRWLRGAMNAIRAVIDFTPYIYTRIAYTSLFGVSLCKGFELVKNFRFEHMLRFSVVDYSSYIEKRTAMREFIVALGKDRRDEEDRITMMMIC